MKFFGKNIFLFFLKLMKMMNETFDDAYFSVCIFFIYGIYSPVFFEPPWFLRHAVQ